MPCASRQPIDERSRARASCGLRSTCIAADRSMHTLNADEEAASLRRMAGDPDFMNLHELVAKARQNLNQNDWDYIVGGTETETTLRRNRMALDSVAFLPRVLRDVSAID